MVGVAAWGPDQLVHPARQLVDLVQGEAIPGCRRGDPMAVDLESQGAEVVLGPGTLRPAGLAEIQGADLGTANQVEGVVLHPMAHLDHPLEER